MPSNPVTNELQTSLIQEYDVKITKSLVGNLPLRVSDDWISNGVWAMRRRRVINQTIFTCLCCLNRDTGQGYITPFEDYAIDGIFPESAVMERWLKTEHVIDQQGTDFVRYLSDNGSVAYVRRDHSDSLGLTYLYGDNPAIGLWDARNLEDSTIVIAGHIEPQNMRLTMAELLEPSTVETLVGPVDASAPFIAQNETHRPPYRIPPTVANIGADSLNPLRHVIITGSQGSWSREVCRQLAQAATVEFEMIPNGYAVGIYQGSVSVAIHGEQIGNFSATDFQENLRAAAWCIISHAGVALRVPEAPIPANPPIITATDVDNYIRIRRELAEAASVGIDAIPNGYTVEINREVVTVSINNQQIGFFAKEGNRRNNLRHAALLMIGHANGSVNVIGPDGPVPRNAGSTSDLWSSGLSTATPLADLRAMRQRIEPIRVLPDIEIRDQFETHPMARSVFLPHAPVSRFRLTETAWIDWGIDLFLVRVADRTVTIDYSHAVAIRPFSDTDIRMENVPVQLFDCDLNIGRLIEGVGVITEIRLKFNYQTVVEVHLKFSDVAEGGAGLNRRHYQISVGSIATVEINTFEPGDGTYSPPEHLWRAAIERRSRTNSTNTNAVNESVRNVAQLIQSNAMNTASALGGAAAELGAYFADIASMEPSPSVEGHAAAQTTTGETVQNEEPAVDGWIPPLPFPRPIIRDDGVNDPIEISGALYTRLRESAETVNIDDPATWRLHRVNNIRMVPLAFSDEQGIVLALRTTSETRARQLGGAIRAIANGSSTVWVSENSEHMMYSCDVDSAARRDWIIPIGGIDYRATFVPNWTETTHYVAVYHGGENNTQSTVRHVPTAELSAFTNAAVKMLLERIVSEIIAS